MEITEFIQNFSDQFDNTDISMFTPKTVFHELDEYSSLVALSIIAMIDEEYSVLIGANEMKKSVTIEELFNAVKMKIK